MPENSKLRILLIEDNPGDARLIREALSAAGDSGLEMEWADRLGTGLERIEARGFDAVLLDLSLPDSRGFQTFERFHQRAPRVPVVVLTGTDDEELSVRAVRLGAQDYLVKGALQTAALIRVLRFAVERNRALDAARGETGGGPPGRILAFMGARGGVGTTSVLLNVAAALAQAGKRVLAVELSPFRGGFSLHLRQAPHRNLSEILRPEAGAIEPDAIRSCLVSTDFGAGLLFAPQDPEDLAAPDPERVGALVQAAAKTCEIVLAELPSVPSAIHAACAQAADPFVLVMERDRDGLASGKNLLSLLRYWGLENDRLAAVLVTKDPLAACISAPQVTEEMGIAVVGVIPPAGEALAASRRRGIPLLVAEPDSLPAENLRMLADRLAAPALAEITG